MECDELIKEDGTKFKVNAEWLHNLCIKWIKADVEDTKYQNDKDYIEGCGTALYENEIDNYSEEIYKLAIEQGMIIK